MRDNAGGRGYPGIISGLAGGRHRSSQFAHGDSRPVVHGRGREYGPPSRYGLALAIISARSARAPARP
jgi:hypothetical protein